ncbi:RagB/SusD family nutrient uptake outer membrane protein [Pollutibacter soli]|uniref:RagB/SusD family nutrient uptake outer membrane protein n=1 Tax=Pollutibacter soli TaxID=3034157 RepID=UPI003013F537
MKLLNLKMSCVSVVVALMLSLSCNPDKLDLLPHGPTEANFFAQESDFSKAVYGIYSKLSDFYWYNAGSSLVPMWFLEGDDITTNASSEPFEVFGPIQPSNGSVSYMYQNLYVQIARANVVLEKIAEVKDGIYTTPNLKSYHKGEALFLRGLAYYHLWNYYGTAPLRNERVTSADQFTPSPTSGTELLDQAIADFKEAATLLPQAWGDADRGRATANSANGMVGKSLVFRASATKTTADYTEALAAFAKLSGLTLVPVFEDNFAFDTENNAESLFEFQASQPFAFDNVWLSNDFDNAIGSMSIFWGYYNNNYALFGQSRWFATPKLVSAFDAGDPRIPVTLATADRTINKYVVRDKYTQSGVASANNPRLLRYADVLLLKAEAILQSGGSTSEAIGLINQVRARARAGGAVPSDFSTSESDKAKIMQWIMDERFRELAGEGQRWFDLRRWHLQGIITLNNAFFNSNVPMAFDASKHLLMPIPNSELDVNPNMRQNAGY